MTQPSASGTQVWMRVSEHVDARATVVRVYGGNQLDPARDYPEGVAVSWFADPEGVVRVDPATSITDEDGRATATVYAESVGTAVVTAGATEGDATVYANEPLRVTVSAAN